MPAEMNGPSEKLMSSTYLPKDSSPSAGVQETGNTKREQSESHKVSAEVILININCSTNSFNSPYLANDS